MKFKKKNDENIDIVISEEEKLLRTVDKGANVRAFSGKQGIVVSCIAVGFSLFQLWIAIFNPLEPALLRSIHLALGLCLVFLLYPGKKSWSKARLHSVDLVMAIVGLAVPLYIVVFMDDLVKRAGLANTTDVIVGIAILLLVFEVTRRTVGWPMIILSLLFLAYTLLGRYVPFGLGHRGVLFENMIYHETLTLEGVFGIPLGCSASFIFLFMLFSAFLEKSGMGQFFIDIANAAAGRKPGGPAKVAVLASALMGTLSGSTTANVVSTGSFTIPMMKKIGYKSEFAGGVEAAASTGGQLMPPIMGAAAFLIAEFTQTPYIKVAAAAAIPAFLYYVCLWVSVHYEAKKEGLKGISRENMPAVKEVMKDKGHLLIPIVLLVGTLIAGYTPMRAGVVGIVSTIICAEIRKNTRMSLRDIVNCFDKGARNAVPVLAACACAGVIVSAITQTGLGLKLGSVLIDLGQGSLFLTMLFTMITSLVLGMGVPTTANYVITSTIAAPAIVMLGAPVLVAHMFVFYYGILADITPPVCIGAVAASGIAKSDPLKTGVAASKVAIVAFIVPFLFVYNPGMIMLDSGFFNTALLVVTGIIGVSCMAAALCGYMRIRLNLLHRLLTFAGGLAMLIPGLYTDVIGLALIAISYLLQKRKEKENPR